MKHDLCDKKGCIVHFGGSCNGVLQNTQIASFGELK